MSIWRIMMRPWQRIRKSNYKNSQNYNDNDDDGITQRTKTITTTNSDSQDSGDKNKTIKIIIDEPAKEGALDFQYYSKNLANIIRETPPQFAVGIFGKWGSGKTTLMKMIKQELDDKDSDKILTVWFDAWRYEREKYLAVIPFLRQIRIALENDLVKNRKTSRWNVLRKDLNKTFNAFIESTELSVAVPGSPVSTTTNFEKAFSSLKANGSTYIDGERIQFHEHVTDYLKNALNKLENQKPGSRIVVFVDDLDRCTPEKALEVLESIKAFFDIKGIVYVVGMDSESIDHIIKEKYGRDSNIKGMDYLEKIVQLPFQIPVWKPEDISGSLEKIILTELEGSKHAEEFKEENKNSLIVRAIEPNPRQVKRFVNNIILAKEVFGKDIDKLIAVQALNFRSEWNRFLELISADDELRKAFFREYYVRWKEEGKFEDLLKNLKEKSNADIALPKEIMDIFQELLINQKDDTLRSFLDAGADEILREIETMEDYRRALEATKLKKEEKELTGKQGPTKKLLLELLKTGRVKEFNNVRSEHHIYYPDLSYADLQEADLQEAYLSFTKLSGAKLSFTELSHAKLSYADLSHAFLSFADLSHSDLFHAKLSEADLSEADLSEADLSEADLSEADLSEADLSHAKLSDAKLSDAKLSDAKLSHADLSNAELAFLTFANLSHANLSGAYLSHADLSNANLNNSIIIRARYQGNDLKCENADFKDAIIDDENLSIQLSNGKAKNVPAAVKTKGELRKKLGSRELPDDLINQLLSHSSLRE
jgi:uncharacterized protein YjbI with pentapeptide repeats